MPLKKKLIFAISKQLYDFSNQKCGFNWAQSKHLLYSAWTTDRIWFFIMKKRQINKHEVLRVFNNLSFFQWKKNPNLQFQKSFMIFQTKNSVTKIWSRLSSIQAPLDIILDLTCRENFDKRFKFFVCIFGSQVLESLYYDKFLQSEEKIKTWFILKSCQTFSIPNCNNAI